MIFRQRKNYLKLLQIYIKTEYEKYKVTNEKGTLVQSSVPFSYLSQYILQFIEVKL